MSRLKLIIMAGIPGSGKSTWAKTFFTGASIISSDAIRLELFGSVYDQSHNGEVFAEFHRRIDNDLKCGLDVVCDATFLTVDSRGIARGIALDNNAETHLILFQNLSQAVMRNIARPERVPDDAMIVMLEKYEQTLRDLSFETYWSVTRIGEFS